MKDSSYEIEDRTRRTPPLFGAGCYLVWKVKENGILPPHRYLAGKYPTLGEAQEAVKKLEAQGTR